MNFICDLSQDKKVCYMF